MDEFTIAQPSSPLSLARPLRRLARRIVPTRGAAYPAQAFHLPPGALTFGAYTLRFASCASDLLAIQRLRFEADDLALDEAYANGLDQDGYDLASHHLMVLDDASSELVGTARLSTVELSGLGCWASARSFELGRLPSDVQERAVEVTRMCIGRGHRHGEVMPLLWGGIARYADWNDKRYVLDCVPVSTQQREEAFAFALKLAREGRYHETLSAPVKAPMRLDEGDFGAPAVVPTLPPALASVLSLGGKVVGGPAMNTRFASSDFLALLDLRSVDNELLTALAAPGNWTATTTECSDDNARA